MAGLTRAFRKESGYISLGEDEMRGGQKLPPSDTTATTHTVATGTGTIPSKAIPHRALGTLTSSGTVDNANVLRNVLTDALNSRAANTSSISHNKNNATTDQVSVTLHDPIADASTSVILLVAEMTEK